MQSDEKDDRVLVKHGVAEFACALAFLIAGGLLMWDSYHRGAGWGSSGPKSGYFPFRIGLIMCIASVFVMFGSVRNKALGNSSFVTRGELKPVLQVLVPILGFVAVAQFLGMYIAAFLLIAGFMRILGKYSWLKSACVGLAVSAAVFWLFEIQFMVPLIKGPLEAAFGY
ncbi:tripartite tricarboxylate transporter TctB family protein [Herminiimonas sp. NPDC097707]|uniref:tripartite tricarboxylate transporter TctB family protein n=1 Tax=Herminiimonas sp. NPDC097707 TaxID=3364007 RepID=UPI00383BA9C8